MHNTEKKEFELDVMRILMNLWRRLWQILLVSGLCAALVMAATAMFVTPTYESSVMFYVNNNRDTENSTGSISSADITAAKNLVNSYIVILETRESLEEVKAIAGVELSEEDLRDMITAESVDSTQIFRVIVSSPDASEAVRIADAIAQILPQRIASVIDGSSAKVVDHAVKAETPSSPSVMKNTVIGFAVGFLLSAAAIALWSMFDVVIRNHEDVEQVCAYPILADVPDIGANDKGGIYAASAKKKTAGAKKDTALLGSNVNFVTQEAYKLLRTKLEFSFADEGNCRVIGVSSALAGEGKSLTAINVAYSLAQLNKQVLLIDCDMRRPSLSAKLPIQKNPGLSNFLIRQVPIEAIFQDYQVEDAGFRVIAAGRTPPNPIELLSSARMESLVGQLRKAFDYVILDLPPVEEVSDALVAAKMTDGILLVVRHGYCDRVVLNTAVQQFEFVGAKILGVVNNCVREHEGRGSRKYGYQYDSSRTQQKRSRSGVKYAKRTDGRA